MFGAFRKSYFSQGLVEMELPEFGLPVRHREWGFRHWALSGNRDSKKSLLFREPTFETHSTSFPNKLTNHSFVKGLGFIGLVSFQPLNL